MLHFTHIKKKKREGSTACRGFSLVESLVAVTILLTATAAILTTTTKSTVAGSLARDRVIAYYLAQSPGEYLHAVRSSNKLKRRPWLTGLSECFGKECTIDERFTSPATALSVCAGGVCPPLRSDRVGVGGLPPTFLYGYNMAWPLAGFTRTVRIDAVSPVEIKITVRIDWARRGVDYSFMITQSLFDR